MAAVTTLTFKTRYTVEIETRVGLIWNLAFDSHPTRNGWLMRLQPLFLA